MKEAILTNGRFSWFLKVDGQAIAFTGEYNADYFEEHHKELGYNVIRKNDNKEEES